jgi:TrpR-related protein YerC/YecD
MSAMEAWRDEAAGELFEAILRLEIGRRSLGLLPRPVHARRAARLAQRWAVVRLLDEGMHYAEISSRTGASTATITRIAQWLHHGEGGYTKALERLRAANPRLERTDSMTRRLRLAIPNKGRLVEPTVRPCCATPGWSSKPVNGRSSPASRTSTWTSCSCGPTTSSSS